MDTNSIELAIALERISLLDTYFHVNRPTSNKLQGNLAIDMPRWDYDDGSKSGRPRLNALINVGFTLSDGPAPEQITPETSGKIALTFGCLLDVAVGSPALGEAIPAGKHVVIEGGDLDAHRNKRMERSSCARRSSPPTHSPRLASSRPRASLPWARSPCPCLITRP